ncbi:MAG: hypothetical protein GY768_20645 [Planctomycetaceae bacterium]|nr:hypothetical protein [Planctomycetaceae bacterium]
MDQLKEFFGVFKRQHFWFIAPVLLGLGIAGWMMSSKKLTSEFEQSRQKVKGYVDQMRGVSSTDKHPNPEFHDGMGQLIQDRRANVLKAWETKWERQKQELKWPEQLPPDFRRKVEAMRPIEKVDPKNNREQRITLSLRRSYGNYIKKELPRLAAEIGAKWQPASNRRGSGGAAAFSSSRETVREPRGRSTAGDAVDESQIVIWNPQNQTEIQSQFDWGNTPPTTFEILYAQEDLWVLATLIDIIKRTNGDVQTRSQAAVKEIGFIQIGSAVERPTFQVHVPQPVGSEEGISEPIPEVNNMPEVSGLNSERGGFDAEGGGLAPQPDALATLVADRYVDIDYQPIADLAGLEASAAVAKRIPVRIRLKIDQRDVYKFLVECANSPLTFEVRQLRFNPQGVSLGANGGGFSGGGREEMANSFTNRNASVKQLPDYESFDRMIEIFGIVYIFNPVDASKLGNEMDEDMTASL